MNREKMKQIELLESTLSELLIDAESYNEKKQCLDSVYYSFLMFGVPRKEGELADYCITYEKEINELRLLYNWITYLPDEDEKALSYLFYDGMNIEKKIKALSDAWWQVNNSGYCDSMANRLMTGHEDMQTRYWEQNCKNKDAISRYYTWLKEECE